MKFCVLAKIAKRSVSFWYQLDNNAYAPLTIKESNEVPLYFYVNGNDFIFGSAARDRFNKHDPNAYGNYFEIIKDHSKHFSIYGNKKPIKQLFYHGVEQCLSYFLNSVLYKTDAIESYRQHFPLRFLFNTDIEDHEKSMIEQLFKEAGYYNLDRIHFNKSLFYVFAQKEILYKEKAILMLSGIDNVLYLNLYKNINADAVGSFKLDGQGADPRVKILAEMIVEYIILQHSYLSIDKDRETASLLSFSASLLENTNPIIKGDAELSDGNKYWFRVNEKNLNDRLQFYSNDGLIYTAIDDLLKSSGLQKENVIILLGTEEISTVYFSNKLLKKYPNVKEVQLIDIKETMQSIFTAIADLDYKLPPPTPPPPNAGPPMLPIAPRPPTPKPPIPQRKEAIVPKPKPIIPKLPEITITPKKHPPLPPSKKT